MDLKSNRNGDRPQKVQNIPIEAMDQGKKTIAGLQENLPKLAEIMMDNLIAFYKEGKVETTYNFYYPG